MRCLVIGGGPEVNEHLSRVNRADFDKVLSMNKTAILYQPVDYHVSLHPNKWAKEKVAWFVAHQSCHAPDGTDLVDEVFPYQWPEYPSNSGSSGLYAVKYALERLNADEVVLAGVGIDKAPHVYNNEPWKQATNFQHTWVSVFPRLTGRVTSLGGWTAELLGQPQDSGRR